MVQRIKIISCVCDHELQSAEQEKRTCGRSNFFSGNSGIKKMKDAGWAVGADGRCYCPDHAPFHRHVGRSGKVKKFMQLKLEAIDDGKK